MVKKIIKFVLFFALIFFMLHSVNNFIDATQKTSHPTLKDNFTAQDAVYSDYWDVHVDNVVGVSKAINMVIPIYTDQSLSSKAYYAVYTDDFVDFSIQYSRNNENFEPIAVAKDTSFGVEVVAEDLDLYSRYTYFKYSDALHRIDWGANFETLICFVKNYNFKFNYNVSSYETQKTFAFPLTFQSGNTHAAFLSAGRTCEDFISVLHLNNVWYVLSEVKLQTAIGSITFWPDYFIVNMNVDYDKSSYSGSGDNSGSSGIGGGGTGSW